MKKLTKQNLIAFGLSGLLIIASAFQASRHPEWFAQSTTEESVSVEPSDPVSGSTSDPVSTPDSNLSSIDGVQSDAPASAESYEVISVVDGDTIKINYQGQTTSVRLIGVNTPETVDPRKSVECFGKEASDYLKKLLEGKTITIAADPTQTDRDKYNRLLRYVYLDGEDVNQKIIASGYGYEYTYDVPYQKQAAYRQAQQSAEQAGKGLWASTACNKATTAAPSTSTPAKPTPSKPSPSKPAPTAPSTPAKPSPATPPASQCNIKGNISKSGEKIYHVPGGAYYDRTDIDTSKGERWFCSEAEAQAAGWRPSKR